MCRTTRGEPCAPAAPPGTQSARPPASEGLGRPPHDGVTWFSTRFPMTSYFKRLIEINRAQKHRRRALR